MKRYVSVFIGSALGIAAFAPSFAHAAIVCGNGGQIIDIESFLCSFKDLINFSIGIVAALALLAFFWGLVKYIAKADDEKAKESGKSIMIWGVVALFVMFSVFGLVRFLQTSFGTTEDTITPPRL